MAIQKDVFMSHAADAYFQRNHRRKPEDFKDDPISLEILRLGKSFGRILDIGCCAGERLDYLSKKLGAKGYGIDPSYQAIKWGKDNFPSLELKVASADDIGFEESFDLIIFSHCLYLVDRSLLMRSLAQADEHLKEGGVLCICDFTPSQVHQKKYKHHEELNVYKCDYAKFFLANPQYTLLTAFSYPYPHEDYDQAHLSRLTTSLLYKNPIEVAYPLVKDEIK